HDISERKKVEDALRKAVEMKTEFTSTVSHELRTPLAAIREGISIVFDGTAGVLNKQQKEFLDIAKRNVDRLNRLINDILDFEKLESGKMAFNIQENDINDAVTEIEKTMRSVVEQGKIDLLVELDKNVPKVKFDRDKILQVLTNLVNNAVKFTEKGFIKIKVEHEDNVVKVSVRDSGIGIKEEDLPRLFGKFEQLNTGVLRKTGGTGLGLSICKDIIAKHNGKIWAESKYGEGSAFIFVLPVREQRG
ncbi:MAG TPA: HAMP domain-containing sensor histidine kinase, partial [Candidatus Omnitrophota bacterium]|nr:HAMP domain-containing sensor histidine kinase [Candidatus Omnitrophota bacterium]